MTGNRLHARPFGNFARHATPICPYRLQATRRTKVETKGDTENKGEISRGSPYSAFSLSLSLSFPFSLSKVACVYVEEGRIVGFNARGRNRSRVNPPLPPSPLVRRRHLLRSSSPDDGVYHPKAEPVQKSPLRERAPRRRKCGNAAARQCLGLGELLGGAQAESTEFVSTGAGNPKASVPRIKVAGL